MHDEQRPDVPPCGLEVSMRTTKPGLTAAMRRGLEFPSDATRSTRIHLCSLGLIREVFPGDFRRTPRGHSALAAPRMTAAELNLLERVAAIREMYVYGGDVTTARKLWRIRSDGSYFVSFDCVTRQTFITHAGRKALNDIRAAMGDERWKS